MDWRATAVVSGPHLTLEREGDLGHLIIEGAPRNELTFTVFDAFADIVANELPSLDVKGLIIFGRGRHFSSGSDIEELDVRIRSAGNESSPSWCEAHAHSFQKLTSLPYPIVAAISGCCLGSGLELALACTARVAAENALLALPEAQHDLIPGCGGTVMLTELVGFQQAARLILSGEALTARQALAIGLVDSVVHKCDLLQEARRLASCIHVLPRQK